MALQVKTQIANPHRGRATRRRKKRNGLLVSLSAPNPHKGKKNMAAKKNKRKHGKHGHRSRSKGRKNPTTAMVARPRPAAKPNRRRSRRNSNRNPVILGRAFTSLQLAKILGGGLIGVAATKLIAANLPANLISTPFMRVLASGAIALAAGMAAFHADPDFGFAVVFGGGLQTASIALNSWLPEVGSRLALTGLGRARRGMRGLVPVPGVTTDLNYFDPKKMLMDAAMGTPMANASGAQVATRFGSPNMGIGDPYRVQ